MWLPQYDYPLLSAAFSFFATVLFLIPELTQGPAGFVLISFWLNIRIDCSDLTRIRESSMQTKWFPFTVYLSILVFTVTRKYHVIIEPVCTND